MKPTGIIRKIDNTGRLIIPAELRHQLNIKNGDAVMFCADDDGITIRKPEKACTICGADKNTVEFKGKYICADCVTQISSQSHQKPRHSSTKKTSRKAV